MVEKKNSCRPALRFPEFQDAPDWEVKKLGEVLFEHKELSSGAEEVFSVSVHKGFINQIEHLGRNFAAKNTNKYNLVKPFDIVYTKSPTGSFPYGIVKQNLSKKAVIVSPLYAVYTPNNQFIGYLIHLYFESYIHTNNFLYPLVQKGAKNTINVNNQRFLEGKLILPTLFFECKKIAAVLSSVDRLIELQSQKLEQLQTTKKALLQQLFPTEGQTKPALRFPEFQDAPDWEVKKLGEFIELQNKKNIENKFSDMVLSVNNKLGFINQKEQFEDREIASKNKSNYKIVEHNNYAYNPSRINVGSIARLKNYEHGIVSPMYIVFKVRDIEQDFFDIYLQTYSFTNSVKLRLSGSVRDSLTFESLELFLISIPSLAEQEKIAAVLSSADRLIELQSQKLVQLQTTKKALLQQLFPTEG